MIPPSQDHLSPTRGRNAHIFLPPKSPASSSATPTFATSADYFSYGSGARKRARPDSSHGMAATPTATQTQTWRTSFAEQDNAVEDARVNERYRLKGGFDTPGLLAGSAFETSVEQDIDARRRLVPRRQSSYTTAASIGGPLSRERNGAARLQSSPNGDRIGWARFAFGLMGKAFNFGSTVFTGFIAGGGKPYGIDRTSARALGASTYDEASTPLPGSWHTEFLGDFEQDNPTSSPPSALQRPAFKRRQTDRDSWIVVDAPDLPEASLRRKPTSPPRSSLASTSRASNRHSLLPTQIRRQTSGVTRHGSPASFPVLQHNRRASLAMSRSPSASTPGGVADSVYVSPDAEKFVKRQVKQERAADRAIGSMSRQLEALIKQGQQALGTKISVEGEGDEDMDGW